MHNTFESEEDQDGCASVIDIGPGGPEPSRRPSDGAPDRCASRARTGSQIAAGHGQSHPRGLTSKCDLGTRGDMPSIGIDDQWFANRCVNGCFTRPLSTCDVAFAWMGLCHVDRLSATEVPFWRRRNLGAHSANVPRGP
jgi:hypothetical protein